MTGPLEGIRVLDLSRTLAGAHTATILADLGAEVICIEPPQRDPSSISKGGLAGAIYNGIDARYNYQVRNKKSLTLNLNREAGRRIFYDLVKVSDVVVENYRPGVAERRGIGYDVLKEINPRLIYCSITGFGSSGPYKDRPAWDLISQAISGLMSITGEPGRPPVVIGVPIVDTATAMNAAQAITAALLWRERTGQGQKVETSLLETGVSLLIYYPTMYAAAGTVPGPHGSSLPMIALNGAFKTKDGYVMTGVLHERQWLNFCQAIGREDLARDPRFETEPKRLENKEELLRIVSGVFLERTTEEWVEVLNRHDVAAAPVNTLDKVVADPQVQHLGLIFTMEGVEGKPIKMVGAPYRFSAFPKLEFRTAPKVGQHTEEILSSLLGYGREEIESLRHEGVI